MKNILIEFIIYLGVAITIRKVFKFFKYDGLDKKAKLKFLDPKFSNIRIAIGIIVFIIFSLLVQDSYYSNLLCITAFTIIVTLINLFDTCTN